MNIDYAKAYSRERIARSEANHRRREVLAHGEAGRPDSAALLRNAVGHRLISLGERLAGDIANAPMGISTSGPKRART